MTAALRASVRFPDPTAVGTGEVDGPTQQRRRLRLAATLAGLHVRTALVPEIAVRRRQRILVCGAARILTALGVRVRVVGPPTPWPTRRPTQLLVGDDLGWLGGLAVVTGVPRTTGGWRAVCAQVLPGTPVAENRGELVGVRCPAVVRYRTDAGPLDRAPATLAEIVAARGLVVEVHLLAPLDDECADLGLDSSPR
jgi:hypothetical protein